MTVNISLRGPDQKAAPGAMPQPRRMVFQLVNTVIGETREPDLANRPQAIGGHADGYARDGRTSEADRP